MLTDTHAAQFERTGVVRLEGAFGETVAREIRDRIWSHLAARHGIEPDDPATWVVTQATGFQALTRQGVFAPVASDPVASAIDTLLGTAWQRNARWGAPFVTFPRRAGRWALPHRQWHLDYPARGPALPLPGVRALAYVSRVLPRAGGTLALAGSHSLVTRLVVEGRAGSGHSTEIRSMLARRHAWLRALWTAGNGDRIRRFMTDGAELDGATVRVVELTGEPGDVILMHPWLLHAPSPNCGTAPRIMIGHSVYRADRQRRSA